MKVCVTRISATSTRHIIKTHLILTINLAESKYLFSLLVLVGSQVTSLWKKLTAPQVISEKQVLLDRRHHHHAQNFPGPRLSGLTNGKQTIKS